MLCKECLMLFSFIIQYTPKLFANYDIYAFIDFVLWEYFIASSFCNVLFISAVYTNNFMLNDTNFVVPDVWNFNKYFVSFLPLNTIYFWKKKFDFTIKLLP